MDFNDYLSAMTARCHARCFFDLAKQELVFNNRSTAAPGTKEKPKLCGKRVQFDMRYGHVCIFIVC